MTRRRLTGAEALTAVREAAETGHFAQRVSIDRYPQEVAAVCEAIGDLLGISVGFLSDASSLSDFPTERCPRFFEKLGFELRVPVAGGDSVVEVCRRMREQAKAGTS